MSSLIEESKNQHYTRLSHKLISKNQSGFRPDDSCINQLLSINHEIYQSFDDNVEVRAVFLYISKAFDKVWHKGLIFKLNENGISDKILNIITDFLSFRKQRVVLNGQASPWVSIEEDVPQDSILGHYYFWFTLMTYLTIYQQLLSSLQMIRPFFW